jgi:hypothetical protein
MVNTLFSETSRKIKFTFISTNFGPKPIDFEIPVLSPYTQDKLFKKTISRNCPFNLWPKGPLLFWSTGPFTI